MKQCALTLLGLALVSALRLQAATNVLVYDPFTVTPGSPLNGTTPQSHGGVGFDPWTAPDTDLNMTGTNIDVAAGSRWAAIPFYPQEGNKYCISVDAWPTHAGGDWFAIGFAETPTPTSDYGSQRLTGWFLLRGTDPGFPLHSFLGYGTDGGAALGWYSGLHTMSVVLDTTLANWTFEYFVDGVSERGPVAFSQTPDVYPSIFYATFGSYGTARGTFDNFRVEEIFHSELTVPVVVEPPKNATVVPGGMAKFTVSASGAKPLMYQWYKNDTIELSGEVFSTLIVRNLTLADNGTKYSVKVSNGLGDTMSTNAILTVLDVPGPLVHKFNFNDGTVNDSIGGVTGALHGTAQVQGGQLLQDGSDAGFVSLSDYVMPPDGNATVVAWFNTSASVGNWSRIFDFGSGTLNYLFFSPRGGSIARFGIDTSTDAEANVSYSPALNDNINHKVAVVIDSTPTATGANGTGMLYVDNVFIGAVDLNGGTALSYLDPGPQNFFGKSQWINTGDAYFKGTIDEVRVYNTALTESEIAALSPDANPETAVQIIEQPVAATSFVGGSAKFAISVIGTTPTYYWLLDGTTRVGGSTNVLVIDPITTNDFGNYSVIVSNNLGAVTSAVVQLSQSFWSYAPWNDDATSGVDTNYLYTHAFNFASAMPVDINGLTFTGILGGSPSMAGSFAVAGIPNVFNNDANTVQGNSVLMATDFIYGGAPGTLTLNGLEPEKKYVLTLYSVAFDAKGVRVIQFSGPNGPSALIDQDFYDNDNGIRINYEYTADASGSVTITNNQTVAGTTFHFYGFCNRMAEKLPPASPPQILAQPQSSAVYLDAPATFSVTAGGPQLNYQWYFNDTALSGATTPEYSIASVKNENFGAYHVVVSNPYGSVTSSVVQLVLLRFTYDSWIDDASSGVDPQYLYTHAFNFNSSANTDINGVTFTAIPGTSPSQYTRPGSFYLFGVTAGYANDVNNITGGSQVMATDFIYNGFPGTLTLTGLTPGQSYLLTLFSVGWEASGRLIRFSSASNQLVTIDQDSFDNDNGIRINYTYVADANGSVTVTTTPVGAGSFHTYGFCNRLLNALPTDAKPEILSQPESAAVTMGGPATLSVTAAGPGTLQYQWQFNGSPIGGATEASYSIPSVEAGQLGNYTVVVSNGNGSTTSVVAQVIQSRWSYASWTDDATSGVDSQYVYTHAYSFGSANNTTINGVNFTGIAGGNPAVADSFKLTGVGSVYNNDANNVTGGSRTVANDFIYGGIPGTLTLDGLVPGKSYLLTLYSVAWEDAPFRTIRFSAADNQVVTIDQDTYNNNNGIRISYEYTADTNGSVTITTTQTKNNTTMHMYGFSNREMTSAPVSLQFTRGTDGSLILAWPESAAGYTLAFTTVLGSGASWQPVATAPVLADGFYKVTITPSDAQSFYRLQK